MSSGQEGNSLVEAKYAALKRAIGIGDVDAVLGFLKQGKIFNDREGLSKCVKLVVDDTKLWHALRVVQREAQGQIDDAIKGYSLNAAYFASTKLLPS